MGSVGKRLSPSCWSVRTRVTVAATLIVGVLLTLGVTIFDQVMRRTVYQDLRKNGVVAIAGLVATVRADDPHGRLRVQDVDFPLLQVADENGRVIARSEPLRGRQPLRVPRPKTEDRFETHSTSVRGVTNEVYVIVERVRTPFGDRTVYAGAPIPFSQRKGFFLATLVAAVLLGTAVVAWIVAVAVSRALLPVRRMSGELAAITGGELDRRVTVPGPVDEVSDLARSVNVTLARLEDVLVRQRAFVADVSHELRSPLAGLRAQLEVALEHPDDEDWEAVARAALGDADRLQGIVTDLLILAKLGAGVKVERQPIDLGELVRTEAARRSRRVPVEVGVEDGIVVTANRGHLIRLLTNLLDNAERHARSRVRVTARRDGRTAVMEVADDGSGIAPEDRERVFLRFHRLAESRERDRGGTGLGLAICRDIAHAHGGTLIATGGDDPGGGAGGEPPGGGERLGGAHLILRLPIADEYT
ncbi:sensor histidine kinase [Actinomadura fibrosa]|uniref:histidine kinase n=1 Tax=Actinomadura fibrosa TaxID=111802 RepID=A0ABW2XPX8_9ACTN|nr:ATP-binding protein [Actinomadura fibrosa]